MNSSMQGRKCVAVSVNDKYIPYFSVLLASILSNAEEGEQYDIVVLNDRLSEEHQKKLCGMIQCDNISLCFLDVSQQIQGYDFFTKGEKSQEYLTKEAYFRLLIPELLPDHGIVLYLDSDIVVQRGWTEIFNIDIEGKLAAGVPDIWDNWKCYDRKSGLAEYREKELGIREASIYFNSGVMLFNLPEMRKTFRNGELIELAASKNWKKHDQDVLNKVCKDRVLLLDYKWNLIECPGRKAWDHILPEEKKAYEDCRDNARMIHFASRKPWNALGVANEYEFWKAAVYSPYFERMFSGLIENQLSHGVCFEEAVYRSIRDRKMGIRFVLKCLLIWTKSFLKK